ncbi:hypothetical protein [Spirillospora sp. NPDC048819]|uniref:hypothetical protein n=1 Tax=Spirillospora sp. NPDC048819 TaxID=3155268 RepID=UPI0033D51457
MLDARRERSSARCRRRRLRSRRVMRVCSSGGVVTFEETTAVCGDAPAAANPAGTGPAGTDTTARLETLPSTPPQRPMGAWARRAAVEGAR